MAVEHAVTSWTSGSGASASLSHNPSGVDRLLVVGVAYVDYFGGVFVDGAPTFAGLPMTEARGATGAGDVLLQTFYLVNPPVGWAQLEVVFSDVVAFVMFATTYSGVHQTTPLGASADAAGTSNSPAVSLASSEDDGMVADFFVVNATTSTVTGSPHGAQVERVDASAGSSPQKLSLGASDDDAGGPVSMAWSLTASKMWAHRVLELRAVPAPPAGVAKRITGRGLHVGRRVGWFTGS